MMLNKSEFNSLDLVIDLHVDHVEVADEIFLGEGHWRLFISRLLNLELSIENFPIFVVGSSLLKRLFVLEHFGLWSSLLAQSDGIFKCSGINLLQNGFQSDERFLQNLVPVCFGELIDDRHKHWEGLVLVCFEDVKEVVVLEEAHGTISDL